MDLYPTLIALRFALDLIATDSVPYEHPKEEVVPQVYMSYSYDSLEPQLAQIRKQLQKFADDLDGAQDLVEVDLIEEFREFSELAFALELGHKLPTGTPTKTL